MLPAPAPPRAAPAPSSSTSTSCFDFIPAPFGLPSFVPAIPISFGLPGSILAPQLCPGLLWTPQPHLVHPDHPDSVASSQLPRRPQPPALAFRLSLLRRPRSPTSAFHVSFGLPPRPPPLGLECFAWDGAIGALTRGHLVRPRPAPHFLSLLFIRAGSRSTLAMENRSLAISFLLLSTLLSLFLTSLPH